MKKKMEELEQLFEELPASLQQEVEDFAKFLLETKVRPKHRKLRLTWAGASSEFRGQFTFLELQKRALESWGDGCSCWTPTSGWRSSWIRKGPAR